MENLYKKMREKGNVLVHPFPGGVIGVYKALKNNEVASIVSDRDINKDGVKTRFFGKCVTFPRGAALLAYRTGARSVFGFWKNMLKSFQIAGIIFLIILRSTNVNSCHSCL